MRARQRPGVDGPQPAVGGEPADHPLRVLIVSSREHVERLARDLALHEGAMLPVPMIVISMPLPSVGSTACSCGLPLGRRPAASGLEPDDEQTRLRVPSADETEPSTVEATNRTKQQAVPIARASTVLGSVSSALGTRRDASAHRQARDLRPPGLRPNGRPQLHAVEPTEGSGMEITIIGTGNMAPS